jgi:hypothetical protein
MYHWRRVMPNTLEYDTINDQIAALLEQTIQGMGTSLVGNPDLQEVLNRMVDERLKQGVAARRWWAFRPDRPGRKCARRHRSDAGFTRRGGLRRKACQRTGAFHRRSILPVHPRTDRCVPRDVQASGVVSRRVAADFIRARRLRAIPLR